MVLFSRHKIMDLMVFGPNRDRGEGRLGLSLTEGTKTRFAMLKYCEAEKKNRFGGPNYRKVLGNKSNLLHPSMGYVLRVSNFHLRRFIIEILVLFLYQLNSIN